MTELAEAIKTVRQRINRYQGKEVNEQNTKTALIDPVLRALGWDVGDLDEVQQEYKRRKNDKPVDYALLLLRTPKLFVEAKALGKSLDDRKWANQIMGYATVAGVEWVVITNGDEYRIYNALAHVPVEEKLFRTVSLADPEAPVEHTLSLLSKEGLNGNDLEHLWEAHFVDRQMKVALDELFSPDTDPSFVRLLKKKVDLPANDIKASLARVQAAFDFPFVPAAPATSAPRRKKTVKADKKKKRRTPKVVGVSLIELIDAGLLTPPVPLFRKYKGVKLEAELLVGGQVRVQGELHPTPSTAASHARATITGRPMATNGWDFWQYTGSDGKPTTLSAAREELLKRRG